MAAIVQRTKGFVRLVGANERSAVEGTIIREGDRLINTPNSDAMIKLNDGAVIAVRANSEMLFAQQRFNPREPKDSSSVMELVRGALQQVTRLIAKTQPGNYT